VGRSRRATASAHERESVAGGMDRERKSSRYEEWIERESRLGTFVSQTLSRYFHLSDPAGTALT